MPLMICRKCRNEKLKYRVAQKFGKRISYRYMCTCTEVKSQLRLLDSIRRQEAR